QIFPEVTGEVIGPDPAGRVVLRGHDDRRSGLQRMEHMYVLPRILTEGERWEFTALVAPEGIDAETGMVAIHGVELTDIVCSVSGASGSACELVPSAPGDTVLRVAPLHAGSEIRVAATVGPLVDSTGNFIGSVGTQNSPRVLAAVGGVVALITGLVTNWWWQRRRHRRWASAPAQGAAGGEAPAWVMAAGLRGRVDDEVVDAWAAQAVADGVLRAHRSTPTLSAGARLHDLSPDEWGVACAAVEPSRPAGIDELRSPWKRMERVLLAKGVRDGWWAGPTGRTVGALAVSVGALAAAIAWALWTGWSNDHIVGAAIMVAIPAGFVVVTHVWTQRRLTGAGLDAAAAAWAWGRRLDRLDAGQVEAMVAGAGPDGEEAVMTALALAAAATGRAYACRHAVSDADMPLRVKVRVEQILGAVRMGELRRQLDETQWLVEVPVTPSRR
ncbi:MAG: hypothetical protein KDB06_11810, partial [Ilumatobacter sp.]|nr:hypothetical protein [Ilumatobacter sp.]